jgi:hypothetical protein
VTTFTSTITAAKTAQSIATSSLNAASATTMLQFANQSTTDQLVISLDGQPASATHGFTARPGETLDLLAIVKQLLSCCAGPGAISVYGPNAGATFAITVA